MKTGIKYIFAIFVVLTLSIQLFGLDGYQKKKVLVVVQGNSQLSNPAIGDGRQLAQLLGHFNSETFVLGVDEYKAGLIEDYDYVFYIGFYARNNMPQLFLKELMNSSKEVIWINTGFIEASASFNFNNKYGFTVSKLDTTSIYTIVKSNSKLFTKGENNINLINITDPKRVNVLATALSERTKQEVPYIVKSSNLLYIADSPFSYATSTDRYLLFADMLHDILNEQHEIVHSAILRIEDITPLDSPDKIRDITDYLSGKGIPFLIGVVPFYVDPIEGVRVSLSEKPDMVDALHYLENNGGSIVMHGVTHQYKDITAADFEFWDANLNKPILEESEDIFKKKIESGLDEFFKNGLNPILWETPHYTASNLLYKTIADYFSSAIEQRLSIENPDYCQFFPYIISKDIFGQKIYPENLGYIPVEKDPAKNKKAIDEILAGAKAHLNVRDGFAGFFFHSFLDIEILKEIVDGIESLGYTFINVKDDCNSVKTNKQILLSGNQQYSLNADDQYLTETYYDINGKVSNKEKSQKRLTGDIKKSIQLNPGEIYKAELTEFTKYEPGFFENVIYGLEKKYDDLLKVEKSFLEPRVVIFWNHYARGSAHNDQASLASVFRSVNVNVDTIFVGQKLSLSNYNLLIVPNSAVEFLKALDYDIIVNFISGGGNIITDANNYLAEELGIEYSGSQISVSGIRDYYFQEERIAWNNAQLVNKFETSDIDEVFCFDINSEFPMVIGKSIGGGKLIYISSEFDPYSQLGYSLYPYLLEYVKNYFNIKPIVKQNNLEVFFDPGYRSKISIEKLVKQWVRQGISIIHAAGWHQYPKYTYDYKKLIDLAHANGILVYAWLEPPQVSQKLWMEHPEWREKNYLGDDVRPSWRYPIALTDKQCLNTVIKEFEFFLNKYDWDGVNLAELYFEAGKGFDNPALFTPMHPSAQVEFREKYNIDLKKIFDKNSAYYYENNSFVRKTVTDYRVNKLNEIYKILLSSFNHIAQKKEGFQIIVTALDSYGSPELREYIGEDIGNLIELQKEYKFVLQVEDPQHIWSTDPMRYKEIGKDYLARIGDPNKLMLDLNILRFRNENDITPFPTLIQTGTESFHLVRSAALGASRLTIYAESSINPQDLLFMSYALAAKVNYKITNDNLEYSSEHSFVLELPNSISSIYLDGSVIFPGRSNSFLVPSGSHIVKFNRSNVSFSSNELQTKIHSFTANLNSIRYGNQDVGFTYESETRAIITLNRKPSMAKLDDEVYTFKVMKGDDCYSMFLPPGKHKVEIIVGDTFAKGINFTSFWSATGIALFGAVSIILLIMMYSAVKYIKYRFKLKEVNP